MQIHLGRQLYCDEVFAMKESHKRTASTADLEMKNTFNPTQESDTQEEAHDSDSVANNNSSNHGFEINPSNGNKNQLTMPFTSKPKKKQGPNKTR